MNEITNEISVDICFNDIPGRAHLKGTDISLYGPWASHTGFRSLIGGLNDYPGIGEAALYAAAEAFYEKNRILPFLVGDEHKEYGHKKLRVNYNGLIEIQLPQWHKGIVAKALEDYGLVMSCPHNYYWVFQSGLSVTEEEARAILRPILSPGTRFADEAELAKQIDRAACEAGYPVRQPLIASEQLFLFG